MNSKNSRLFDELSESKISKKSMAITKGGTDTSDAGGTGYTTTSDADTGGKTTTSDADPTGGKTTTSDADVDLG